MVAVLLSEWDWNPSILVGLAALALFYAGYARRSRERGWGPGVSRWQIASYYGGLLALSFALVSPLDALADDALFSAHMLQHLLMLDVVPPLMLFGLPVEILGFVVRRVPPKSIVRKALAPMTVLAAYILDLWLWHVPFFYDAALGSENIHVIEHLCFLFTATFFWWPVIRASSSFGMMPDGVRILYIFGVVIGSLMLAAILTFSTSVLYPHYLSTPEAVRLAFGIPSALVDQQIGGVVMWVGGGLWHLGAIAIILFKWMERPVEDDRPLRPVPTPASDNGVRL